MFGNGAGCIYASAKRSKRLLVAVSRPSPCGSFRPISVIRSDLHELTSKDLLSSPVDDPKCRSQQNERYRRTDQDVRPRRVKYGDEATGN